MNIQEKRKKINDLEVKLSLPKDSLFDAVSFETGGTFDPTIKNSISGAIGLIQFMPSTAVGLGTTVNELSKMDFDSQLIWVEKYFKNSGQLNNIKSDWLNVYLTIFFPAAIKQNDNYILQTSKLTAQKIASQNQIFDLNKDKKITKGEVREKYLQYCNRLRAQNGIEQRNNPLSNLFTGIKNNPALLIIGGLIGLTTLIFLTK